MKKISLSLVLLFLVLFSRAQVKNVSLNLLPLFNSQKLALGKAFFDPRAKDSVRIDQLRFYISGIRFLSKGKEVAAERNSYHLLDLEDSASLKINCSFEKAFRYDEIRFNLGIDSVTNVSGVMGGDLDPTKGMYWTWQSGYINFKIEGTAPECATRNHVFLFHVGGYSGANASLQTVALSCPQGGAHQDIVVDLGQFLGAVDLKQENEVMSPGPDAVHLAKLFAAAFSIRK
jgi:hypothetical protein